MTVSELITIEEAIMGDKLLRWMESKENVEKMVEMLLDRQAEAIAKGYKLGLEDGVKIYHKNTRFLAKAS